MSFEEFESPRSPAWGDLALIAYLCGYTGQPINYNIYSLMKQCVSIGPYGWGLALFALHVVLSGGSMPFYAVTAIPPGFLGRIRNMCVLSPEKITANKIVDFEGFFTFPTESVYSEETEEGEVEERITVPDVFALCITYEDLNGGENHRCFLIRHLRGKATYPFLTEIPSDETIEKLITICYENPELTEEERRELLSNPKYGKIIIKKKGEEQQGKVRKKEEKEEEIDRLIEEFEGI